ncbi:MAG: hypothetical protein J0M24_13035 [Verrucomicrobia bacterium]|nr:hypothetical protein [Verrucomicrobiota bacterium]
MVVFLRSFRRSPLGSVLLLLLAVTRLAAAETPLITLMTDTAAFEISTKGSLQAVRLTGASRNLIAPGQLSPWLQLRVDGKFWSPEAARWEPERETLDLRYYAGQMSVKLRVQAKSTHVAAEVLEVRSSNRVECVVWGPYPTVIDETIGEIVGVVRDREAAVGIQSLNPKTLGGFPVNENDMDVEFGADDRGFYPGLPAELTRGQGFRGDVARAMPFGSVLQAYCRDRSEARILSNWGHERYRVPPWSDGGVVGSRIALFAVPTPEALTTVGKIEVAEGLPHPQLDGEWAKTAQGARSSYLIVDFSEETVDRAIEMTRKAGLKYLYHSSPFATWGHFKLKPALFPRGWEGFRACVEKARKVGVQLGFHTLSNFITPDDPYVAPTPDSRLAVIGSADLKADLTADTTEIEVSEPSYFQKASALNTVRIGSELIRFKSVSSAAPWKLAGCQRGAWGTQASAHSAGVPVARLLDHDYKVFLADADLSVEIARNIARFCNETGAGQLSFDGLEGNWASGYGQYGRTLFTDAWYRALDPERQGTVINDASNPGHYNWHINTRMNWGEPWYAGFRESQTLYRFKNQVLFERNFMPSMLGWFALRSDTSLEDAEWLLARAAGFNAGFALATSLASTAQLAADPDSADTARQYGALSSILATIHRWETARMAGAFSPSVRARLRDNSREFQLEEAGPGRWKLREAFVGRPASTNATPELSFLNPAEPQPLQWLLRSTSRESGPGPRVSVNGREIVNLAATFLSPGGAVRYAGGTEAVVYDSAWREVGRVPVDPTRARVGPGESKVALSPAVLGSAPFKWEVRTLSPVELIP